MTREEAIKNIKEWDFINKDDMEVISTLIPELVESEDERIRKRLVDCLKVSLKGAEEQDAAGCSRQKDIEAYKWGIAYLEKQEDANKEYWRGYREGKQEILDKYTEIKKQNKQKPVEKPINWTELTWKDIVELEGIINNVHYEFRNGIGQESFGKEVLEKFREYKGDEYLDGIEQKPVISNEVIREGIAHFGITQYQIDNWLKKHINVMEQKPVDWNFPCGVNETADKLIAIAECLEMDGDCMFNGYSGTECGKFLRELARKQVECKPAEWSEDEKTVQLIKKVLYDSKNGVEHMIGDTDYYKCLDWIEKKEELGLRNTDALEKWLKDSVSRFISQLEYGSTIDIDALISDMRKQDFYNDLLKKL